MTSLGVKISVVQRTHCRGNLYIATISSKMDATPLRNATNYLKVQNSATKFLCPS